MKVRRLAGLVTLILAVPLSAQTMDHMMMPGMNMPAKKPATKPPRPAKKLPTKRSQAGKAPASPAPRPALDPHAGHDMSDMKMPRPNSGEPKGTDPHAGHDMSAVPGMDAAPAKDAGQHAGHDMASMPGMIAPAGTDLNPGNARPPAPVPGLTASRYYGEAAMEQANRDLRREHGGMTYYQILFNLAEYQARKGGDGYRWDGEAWIGGDINRLTLKSEGQGTFGKPLEQAEVQALYSRALDPYWNLQAGIRHDIRPTPSRTYATIGIEGLAPYWFDMEAALFISDKGDVLGRAEAWYDERVTQFVVLQPRVEANFAAQDVPRDGIGSGLSDLELGLRLRYDKSREFGPYLGVSWQRQFGDTARLTRARGDDTGGFSFVAGVRTWF